MAADIELKVRLTPEEWVAVTHQAEAECRSHGNLARYAIKLYLRALSSKDESARAYLGQVWARSGIDGE